MTPACTILLIDDEALIRLGTVAMLEDAGYFVFEAGNADEALAMLAEHSDIDVVVTDVMMPRMHGHELARRIRQVHTDAKILYVTGYSDALFDAKLWLWEDEALLEKPCTPDGVVEAVSLLVDRPGHPTTVWG